MTFQQELGSWMFPKHVELSPLPDVGSRAPSTEKLSFPQSDGKPTIVTFLRHCGCPFAEKIFLCERLAAATNRSVSFIAVSHSNLEASERWIESVGGLGKIHMIVDPDREVYARWGLGVSSFWHVLNPWSMLTLVRLGREEGIWNRPTESGSRWQSGGTFAIAADGTVKWAQPAASADSIPDYGKIVQALKS